MGLNVNTCCGCCSVRTGAMVIAILQFICSFVGVIAFSIAIALTNTATSNDPLWQAYTTTPASFYSGYETVTEGNDGSDNLHEFMRFYLTIVYSVLLGTCCLYLLFSSLLLAGTITGKRPYVMAWIVFSSIVLALLILRIIFTLTLMPSSNIVIFLLVGLIFISFKFYLLVVVKSFHVSLLDVPYANVNNVDYRSNHSMNVTVTTSPPPYPSEVSSKSGGCAAPSYDEATQHPPSYNDLTMKQPYSQA